MPARNQPASDQIASGSDSRRAFLLKSGLTAGGLGLLGQGPAWGQATDPTPSDCAPPFPSAPAVKFVPNPNQPLRVRKSAFELSDAEAGKLNAAYQALRDLSASDPNNPIGWMQQANVHCYYCGGPNSDQLPEIHDSWWFFAWHRCYLYFHERILASVAHDPMLTLPYWDWENPDHRVVPPVYLNQPALHDPFRLRGAMPNARMPEWFFDGSESSQGGPEKFIEVMNTTSTSVFMGTEPSADPLQGGTAGVLENGQHGIIHVWTGQPSLAGPGAFPDMGVLATAARDPIFFSHHANIDRLWSIWLSKGNTPPSATSWLNQPFFFYDEKGVWTSITVKDVVQAEANLRYQYQGMSLPPMALFAMEAHGASGGTKKTLTPEPATVSIEVPSTVRTRPAEALETAPAPPARAPRPRVDVLHIDNVVVPMDQVAIVRVFINKPDANAQTPGDDPHCVGYFTVVPRTLASPPHPMPGGGKAVTHLHRPKNIQLDVTRKIGKLLGSGGPLKVTLVPMGGSHTKPQSIQLTYGRVYLTVEE